MSLGHEKLDVCNMSIDYVAWVYKQTESLKGIHIVEEKTVAYNTNYSDLDFDKDLDFDASISNF